MVVREPELVETQSIHRKPLAHWHLPSHFLSFL